jgi:hypothetical protein
MFRRLAPCILLWGMLALAGCGGSSHSSGTSTTSATTTTSAPTTGSGTTAARSGSGGSGGAGLSSGGGASSAAGPSRDGSGAGGSNGGSSGGGGGAINARVPATYHLIPPGRLTPPTISVPAFIAVEITVASADPRPHTVQVRTPVPHTLHVPAHGRAGVRIPGLRAGTYPITVDGAPRGTLAIGGEPGP